MWIMGILSLSSCRSGSLNELIALMLPAPGIFGQPALQYTTFPPAKGYAAANNVLGAVHAQSFDCSRTQELLQAFLETAKGCFGA